jgi:hypothetical protein
MRDRTVVAALIGALLVGVVAWYATPTELSPGAAPNASFTVDGDPGERVVVEHAGGAALKSGSLRVLVYEDRPIVPDRTVHGSTWRANDSRIDPGDRLSLADPRFEAGQRLVVRWYGDEGQATLHETRL